MGWSPYECEICGGGYSRCGRQGEHGKDCEGGQFCWEEDVIIERIVIRKDNRVLITNFYEGKYEGSMVYFFKKKPPKISHPGYRVKEKIYCRSCFTSSIITKGLKHGALLKYVGEVMSLQDLCCLKILKLEHKGVKWQSETLPKLITEMIMAKKEALQNMKRVKRAMELLNVPIPIIQQKYKTIKDKERETVNDT